MAVEIKQFTCPKCGTPLELKNAGRSKSIICPSCGSQIDLTSPGYQIIGNVGKRPEPQATQFKVGMKGAIDGVEHEIIGRVVYHSEEDDIWDEWLLLSAAGEFIWISDSDNEGMALWRGFVPTEPVDPSKIADGMRLNLRNASVTVRDVGRANIDYLEGELTWKARVNDKMSYAEADGPNQRISIEFTQNEIEFYWGRRMDRAGTARAFGVIGPKAFAPGSAVGSPQKKGPSWVFRVIVAVILIFVLFSFCGGIFSAMGGLLGGGGSSTSSSGSSGSSGSSSSWFSPSSSSSSGFHSSSSSSSIRSSSHSSSSHSSGGGGGK